LWHGEAAGNQYFWAKLRAEVWRLFFLSFWRCPVLSEIGNGFERSALQFVEGLHEETLRPFSGCGRALN
jgi:hypothetical protein